MHKYTPKDRTEIRLHANFQQYGTTADRSCSGRQQTSRIVENVALVRDSVAESPETSIQRRGSQLHPVHNSISPKIATERFRSTS
ncbi:hypothetical protein GWI33_001364 [Rhynchophorus ferrugineus]|uniref:Uncharacterized protein n=1 Tax=Rhynchophorus ferrugineus TaxID=354439 RepID=A0A834HK38_RHYFE|nr:hypothetical protein GWI33_001530 [Rhynchophorus ferrugineus]KAF7263675.1 hypothetical protein GWI33_001364 [Rhynchophorus ferrugineus]